ncbi:MAG: FAD-binding oxidoreductase, partial [Sphingobium sp.]
TLGLVTAATLRLVPAIADSAVAWVGVDTPHAALALLRFLENEIGPAVEGFEVIPDDMLNAVLRHIPGTRAPIATRAAWNILVEIDLNTQERSASSLLEQALAAFFATGQARDAVIAANKTQAEQFWRLRESVSEAERARGPALQFDVSVPVHAMPDFMIDIAASAEKAFPGTSAGSFGHLGDGNVHLHVRAPTGTSDGARWRDENAPNISAFVHDVVTARAGSISAEHGIGQMKRAEFGRLASPAQIGVLRAIKCALDPLGIMNPGKLIPLASVA